MTKSKKKTRIIVSIAVTLFIAFVLAPIIVAIYIDQSTFEKRFESNPATMQRVEDFAGLSRERHTFASNNGQILAGYKYFKENANGKGLIVMAHGFGGGGHAGYMDFADFFAENGYTVFAYDATGNDESGGDAVGGFPQGVIDLDYALRYIKSSPEFEGLPIMLFGHSWGAYSSGSVLRLHPDVKAAVLAAGFNKSIDLMRETGHKMAGLGSDIAMPMFSLLEALEFGSYASYSCIDGFDASNAGVMIIHSEDDAVVSFENHFMRFYDKYQNDPRFVFVRYENRGHNGLFEANDELMDQIVEFYNHYAN